MAPLRRKLRNSHSLRDLAAAASTSPTASLTSEDMPRMMSEHCYPLALANDNNKYNNALALYENKNDNKNYNALADVDEDEHVEPNHEEEQYYFEQIKKIVKRKYELYSRGELDLNPKKKQQTPSFPIHDELLAVNKNKKMKRYAGEDELILLKQNKMNINRMQIVPSKYVYVEDEEDYEEDDEDYKMEKNQRNKASSSRRPHKAVKNYNKKNKDKKKLDIISNDITECLKDHVTHQLNGTNMMLVIQKQLFASDLAANQNRLTMPCNQVQTSDFLTEKQRLECTSEMDALLLGPTLQMFDKPMKFIKWPINTTESYILRTGWNSFVKENKDVLKIGATIQVWSFRKEDQNKLCFAIAVVKKPE